MSIQGQLLESLPRFVSRASAQLPHDLQEISNPSLAAIALVSIGFAVSCSLPCWLPRFCEYLNPTTRLDLHGSQLTVAPNLRRYRQLRVLNLFGNQLTQGPDVRQNRQLTSLSLGENQITRAPDVRQNRYLVQLYLDHNQLTEAPDISQNSNLISLDLRHNQLTELPDSILSLSSLCNVLVEHNLFTPEYIQAFRQRLQQHRAGHPGEGPRVHFFAFEPNPGSAVLSLEDQIASWQRDFETAFPQESARKDRNRFQPLLSSLDRGSQELLSQYLGNLRGTKDYINGSPSRDRVVERVYNMLDLAARNEEFRNGMLALINEGLRDCHDRRLIIFNEIEILWRFHSETITESEFRDLAIRAQRYEELKKHAKSECRARGLGDEIETILYFHLKLKEALDLPITTRDMLYPDSSGVTDAMLKAAREKIEAMSEEDLLSKSDYWQERMNNRHQEESAKVTDRFGDLLGEAEEYFRTETDEARDSYLKEHSALGQFIEQNLVQNYLEAVDQISRLRNAGIAGLGAPQFSSSSSSSSSERRDRDGDVEMEVLENAPSSASSSSSTAASEALEDADVSMSERVSKRKKKTAKAGPSAETRKKHKK